MEHNDVTIDHLLQIPEDMTGRLLNVFHDFESSNYTFNEDFVTLQEILDNQKYYTSTNLSQSGWQNQQYNNISDDNDHEKIYEICTNTVVNSSIAISCGPYFDQDIMNALSEEELHELFDLDYHTKHVDTIFARVFGS